MCVCDNVNDAAKCTHASATATKRKTQTTDWWAQLIRHIHITPQLLDQHITLTHDCHVAESSHHRATHAPESSMESNHGWWTEVCVRRDYIYILPRTAAVYILSQPLRRASHRSHQSRRLMRLRNAFTSSKIHMFGISAYPFAADVQSHISCHASFP